MEYVKDTDGKIYKVTQVKEEVDLEGLKAELAQWQGMTEPSLEEQLEVGRQNHPYYTCRIEKIRELKAMVQQLEAL